MADTTATANGTATATTAEGADESAPGIAAAATAKQPRKRGPFLRGWRLPAALILLSFVPAVAGAVRLGGLAAGGPVTPGGARFSGMPAPVVLHILTAVPYCVVGAFQFAPAFRRKHLRWHRIAGRFLAPAGVLAAVSGLWMTLAYDLPAADGATLGPLGVVRLAFATAMAGSIVLGVVAIARRRDVAAHRAWMMRGYAIGQGAGTQAITHLPWFVLVGTQPPEYPRLAMMIAAWVINLAVAEWYIRRHARPRPRRAPRPAPRLALTESS
jgi:uncharacterized membrane protein